MSAQPIITAMQRGIDNILRSDIDKYYKIQHGIHIHIWIHINMESYVLVFGMKTWLFIPY